MVRWASPRGYRQQSPSSFYECYDKNKKWLDPIKFFCYRRAQQEEMDRTDWLKIITACEWTPKMNRMNGKRCQSRRWQMYLGRRGSIPGRSSESTVIQPMEASSNMVLMIPNGIANMWKIYRLIISSSGRNSVVISGVAICPSKNILKKSRQANCSRHGQTGHMIVLEVHLHL